MRERSGAAAVAVIDLAALEHPILTAVSRLAVGVIGACGLFGADRLRKRERQGQSQQDRFDALGPVKQRASEERAGWQRPTWEQLMTARRSW